MFNNEFIGSEWNDKTQTHTVHIENTISGSKLKLPANVIISAAGPLVQPQFPEIPGVNDFQGPYFHNLRWDSDVKLDGNRVAVIGNGSSGIQLIVRCLAPRPDRMIYHQNTWLTPTSLASLPFRA